jgi:hypothetical protein
VSVNNANVKHHQHLLQFTAAPSHWREHSSYSVILGAVNLATFFVQQAGSVTAAWAAHVISSMGGQLTQAESRL